MVKLSDNNDDHQQFDFAKPTDTMMTVNLSFSSETFLAAAIALKQQVVEATWTKVIVGGGEITDITVYTGLLGTAFTCLRFYESNGSHRDLQLSADIIHACASNTSTRYMTFLCGRGGLYALGAVVAYYSGDHDKRNLYLTQFLEVFPRDREFRDAAIEAGEVVWKRGLLEKAGLDDGASGNAYAFLALYRLTGDTIYQDRAKAFGGLLYRNTRKLITATNSHELFSLFQGLAGTACLWSDLVAPQNSRFPGFEI